VEATLSQGVRGFGLGRCRYIGLGKVRLQHVATAAGDQGLSDLGLAGRLAPFGDADVAVRAAVGLIGTPTESDATHVPKRDLAASAES
jgi:hypothetical protein